LRPRRRPHRPGRDRAVSLLVLVAGGHRRIPADHAGDRGVLHGRPGDPAGRPALPRRVGSLTLDLEPGPAGADGTGAAGRAAPADRRRRCRCAQLHAAVPGLGCLLPPGVAGDRAARALSALSPPHVASLPYSGSDRTRTTWSEMSWQVLT